MSIYGAMFSGVSGLNAQSQSLAMISDNISNVNTVGYKTSKAYFSTLVTSSTQNNYNAGGVRSTPIYDIDRQGLVQNTSNQTDMAISGQGFFTVTNSATPASTDLRFFTRAGSFRPDADGYLRTPTGYYLQGWATDSAGVPTATDLTDITQLTAVKVNAVSGSARSTSSISLGLNLPASAAAGTVETTQMQIYDSLGVSHTVTFTWTKNAANDWTVTAAAPDAGSVEEGTVGSGTPYSVNVLFNGDGTPASFDGAATPPDLALGTWSSGANDSVISMNLGTAGTANGLTQFASTYSTTFLNQDGAQFGNFYGVSVDDNGIVTALYDNGQSLKIYKIPVATFANPDGLNGQTGTVFLEESAQSGQPILHASGTGDAGKFIPSSLEASTTDLATEFTTMIIAQQAYSASAKVITTADEMLTQLMQIKR